MTIQTVSQLTLAIKTQLETKFQAVQVKGEISNLKFQSSGHIYFTLKDAESQIAAVLFKGNAQKLSRMPKEGDEIVARGELTVYPPRGSYQILVREVQFAGVGELLLKLHELKKILEARGWLSAAHKKPLPKFPKTIGVITSPTGAVIQDIIHVLSRRFSGFQLLLNPVKVQGEGSAQEIAQAIAQFNEHKLADVLIVGRGGGSLEDLWAFNEEIVAQAIFESKIPVISAVGHETDYSISDLVADVRAPTPSAAAEMVIGEKAHQLLRFDEMDGKIERSLRQAILQKKLRLQTMHKQADALKPSFQITTLKNRLKQIDKALFAVYQTQLQRKKERFKQLVSHLRSIDPKNLFTKGYCILFSENKETVILSTKDLHPNLPICLMMQGGEAKATITEITP